MSSSSADKQSTSFPSAASTFESPSLGFGVKFPLVEGVADLGASRARFWAARRRSQAAAFVFARNDFKDSFVYDHIRNCVEVL